MTAVRPAAGLVGSIDRHINQPVLVTSGPIAEEPRLEPERESSETFQIQDWTSLVERIHTAQPGAMEELYAIFEKGIRYFLLRSLGPDELDDRVAHGVAPVRVPAPGKPVPFARRVGTVTTT